MNKKSLNKIEVVKNFLEMSDEETNDIFGGTIMTHMVALADSEDL